MVIFLTFTRLRIFLERGTISENAASTLGWFVRTPEWPRWENEIHKLVESITVYQRVDKNHRDVKLSIYIYTPWTIRSSLHFFFFFFQYFQYILRFESINRSNISRFSQRDKIFRNEAKFLISSRFLNLVIAKKIWCRHRLAKLI